MIDIVNHESELVFFYSQNSDLCSKLISLKDGIKNPFSHLLDWISEEEIEVEALIEAIKSMLELGEKKRKMQENKNNIEKEIVILKDGKNSVKSIFSFKSKKDDLIDRESEKTKVILLFSLI